MKDAAYRKQLLRDLEALGALIVRYARGDRSVRVERDVLDAAVQVKFALWRAVREHARRGGR